MKKLLFITLLTLALYSCGSRKVQLQKTEVKTEIAEVKKDTAVVLTNVVKSEIVKSENDNFTITPIDTTKEIIITDNLGKVTKYKNAVLKHENKKVAQVSTTHETTQENKGSIAKTEVKQVISVKQKETKKDNTIVTIACFSLLLLLIAVGVYYYSKKIKAERDIIDKIV